MSFWDTGRLLAWHSLYLTLHISMNSKGKKKKSSKIQMSSQSKMLTEDWSKISVPGGCWIRLCSQTIVVAFLLSGGVFIFGNLPGKQIHNLTVVKIHFYCFECENFLVVALFLPLPPRTNPNKCSGLWGTLWFVCSTGCCVDMQNSSVLLWN